VIQPKPQTEPRERFLHIGNVALNVAEWMGDGPPLVMVHGWGVSWQVWHSVAPLLAKDFHVFAFDLRGHGRSGRVLDDHQRVSWVEDTVRLMERLTPDGAAVVGHSLGGWVSLALPSIAPGLAKKIVSEDPYVGAISLVGDRARGDPSRRVSRPDANAVEAATSVEPLAAVITEHNPRYSREIVERLAMMQFRLDPVLIRGSGTRSEMERSYDEMLAKIDCPVLLMHGAPEKGGIMDDVGAARVASLIDNAPQGRSQTQVVSWPHTGHNLHVARNFDFAKVVRRFLQAE
jgi:pimeloyl-ACP methyl ester carboxylesterase